MRAHVLSLCLLLASGLAFAAPPQPNSLLGIHWYGNTAATDVEALSASQAIWVMGQCFTDTDSAIAAPNTWELAWQTSPSVNKTLAGPKVAEVSAIAAKGHGIILRLQPNWGRNVPYTGSPADPYTLANYSSDAAAAYLLLKDYCRVFIVGNEVNLDSGENTRWNGSSYATTWQPTPAQYAATYLAVRDAIHAAVPVGTPANQQPIVLMQPVSPGGVGGTRFMDGYEFLYRQVEALAAQERLRIDGFALHAYAEPGGSNFGADGFFASLQNQLMIIDSFGLGQRPAFITEFNKDMPNSTEAAIGAKFAYTAYAQLAAWNAGSGAAWPGYPNHPIVGATWFVYPSTGPSDVWNNYSLQWWKSQIVSTDKDLNPWYGFQHAATQGYTAGGLNSGPQLATGAQWWRDNFDGASLDTATPLPKWTTETSNGGAVSLSGSGALRLTGSASWASGAIRPSSEFIYGDFRLETTLKIQDAGRAGTASTEANVDIQTRLAAKGYSLTFWTSGTTTADARRNKIALRRTNVWTFIPSGASSIQTGDYSATPTGGINSGDIYNVVIVAKGSTIRFQVDRVSPTAETVANWTLTDDDQRVGSIRVMTYNLKEAQVDSIAIGDADWKSAAAALSAWSSY